MQPAHRKIRVVQYGLGPIGMASARAILAKASHHVELVGAIDIAPDKAGRALADVLGDDGVPDITVSADATATLAALRPDVVLHTTSSFLDRIDDQIADIIRAGVNIVSSAEELSFPFERHPERAQRLDALAREYGVVVTGTGVNPGFSLDTLVLTATAPCASVHHIEAHRVVDAGTRRGPLQMKVGAGISVAEFDEKKATGRFGHIGLRESLWMIGHGLGWTFDAMDESLHPMIAETDHATDFVEVKAGQVAGIHHRIVGRRAGQEKVILDLKMYVGADDPHDAVRVEGDPPVDLYIRGGLAGDTATIAMLVNTIPRVLEARPGLHPMTALAVPRAFAV